MTSFGRRSVVMLLPCLVGLALFAAGSRAQDAQVEARLRESFTRARGFHKDGQYARAAEEYEKVLGMAPRVYAPDAPDMAVILTNLAIVYKDLHRYNDA